MKRTTATPRFVQLPDIESMYHHLFWSFSQWTASSSEFRLSDGGPPLKIRPACKYSLIINAYSILDAIIHSYVVLNGFETSKNENDWSVYSKWKKFPYEVEKNSFSKKEIKIIDEIRELRNQIAHPKAASYAPEPDARGAASLELLDPESRESKSYLNLVPRPQFTPSHGSFLTSEITRLIILANNTLTTNTPFLPTMLIRSGDAGQKWPKEVQVL